MESKQKVSEKMIGVVTDINCTPCTPPESMKQCSNCERTYTPLWRSGPVGPKTLCNACGIRYSKKRSRSATSGGGGAAKKARNVKGKYEGKLIPLGKEVVEGGENPPKNWNEVEIAALLLLALSCGVVFT